MLAPGLTELEIAAVMHEEIKRRELGYAWGPEHCPAVNAGPDKDVGHSGPSELRTKRGELLHMDFGVARDDYRSDLQRVWYLLDEGETEAPPDVVEAWDAVWAAVDAGVDALRPGAIGWKVDEAARSHLVAAGYPEPMYSLGHQLGRSAHDGGTLLGPRWDRYGKAPYGLVEEGNVYTLEFGTAVPNRGYVGLEEDVARHRRRRRVALDAAARTLARALAGCRLARRARHQHPLRAPADERPRRGSAPADPGRVLATRLRPLPLPALHGVSAASSSATSPTTTTTASTTAVSPTAVSPRTSSTVLARWRRGEPRLSAHLGVGPA